MKRIGDTIALAAAGWSWLSLESVAKYGPAVGATMYYGVKIFFKVRNELRRRRERREWE